MSKFVTRESPDRKHELDFQFKIIASYRNFGGEGRKWAGGWQNGNPDLILTHPDFGMHLAESKHEPMFGVSKGRIANPMTTKQIEVATDFIKGGANVYAAIIGFSSGALGSRLGYFDPRLQEFHVDGCTWVGYKPKVGFHVKDLLFYAPKL